MVHLLQFCRRTRPFWHESCYISITVCLSGGDSCDVCEQGMGEQEGLKSFLRPTHMGPVHHAVCGSILTNAVGGLLCASDGIGVSPVDFDFADSASPSLVGSICQRSFPASGTYMPGARSWFRTPCEFRCLFVRRVCGASPARDYFHDTRQLIRYLQETL